MRFYTKSKKIQKLKENQYNEILYQKETQNFESLRHLSWIELFEFIFTKINRKGKNYEMISFFYFLSSFWTSIPRGKKKDKINQKKQNRETIAKKDTKIDKINRKKKRPN